MVTKAHEKKSRLSIQSQACKHGDKDGTELTNNIESVICKGNADKNICCRTIHITKDFKTKKDICE